MTTNRRQADGFLRRVPDPRNWAKPPGLLLIGLALVGLLQSGCRSDGCTNCGIGSKISNGVQALTASVTKHFNGCGNVGNVSDCGCGGEGAVYDSGVPISGGMVIPAPGTIIQAPAVESPPTQLEAIPTNPTGATGSSPSSTRSTPSGASRSGYTTSVPKGNVAARRGSDVNRALLSTNDSHSRAAEPGVNADLLDTINIPPVDLPSSVTQKAVNPPGTSPTAKPTAMVPAAEPAVLPAAEKVSAADGAIESLPPIAPSTLDQVPGIRRFASVAPTVGGGSAPSIAGLDWLKEKGYRYYIDLRKGSEVEPNFAEAVNDRNMVYISLPIVANRLDSSRLARFDDLISQIDNRPLYFADSDGTRAGLLWYVHLRLVNQEDSQSATSKSEELGLTATEQKQAEAYLATAKPRAKSAMAKVALVPAPAPPATAPGSNSPPVPAALPVSPATAPSITTPPVKPGVDESVPPMLPGEERPQALHDSSLTKPVAAIVLTGIGVPLACWSRSAFSVARSNRKRASLPGPAPRSPDALASSDA